MSKKFNTTKYTPIKLDLPDDIHAFLKQLSLESGISFDRTVSIALYIGVLKEQLQQINQMLNGLTEVFFDK